MNDEEIKKILEERKQRLQEGFEPLFGEWPLEEYESSNPKEQRT